MEDKTIIVNKQLIETVIHSIDEYYDFSFKIQNDRCYPLLIKLTQDLEALLLGLNTVQQMRLGMILNDIVVAMTERDHVRIRDIMKYELRVLMTGFLSQ